MPFVKSDKPERAAPDTVAADTGALAGDLHHSDPDVRWSAARALAERADGGPPLAEALGREHVPRVREAIMTGLMRIGDSASVAALLPSLRSSDASERNAAVEALQALPHAIPPFLPMLLDDTAADVRILAVELVRGMAAADATRWLCGLLDREQNPNVCAAAIDVLAEVGTRDAIPVLRACAQRFAGVPFLPFAVSRTIAILSGPEGL